MNLVKEVWLDQGFLMESDIQLRFVWKLKELKNQTKTWARIHRSEKLLILEKLEEELNAALQSIPRDGRDLNFDCHIKNLEAERNSLLLLDEELWRQRSKATWLKSGDRNTRYFHNFACAQ